MKTQEQCFTLLEIYYPNSERIKDVLECIIIIKDKEFNVADLYKFEYLLSKIHPNNHNIYDKILEMLQKLRDIKIIEFLDYEGNYRKNFEIL